MKVPVQAVTPPGPRLTPPSPQPPVVKKVA
jgi:hypothetical protein